MKRLLIFILIAISAMSCVADEISDLRDTLVGYRKSVDEYKKLPSSDAIPEIGRLLLKTSQAARFKIVIDEREETLLYISSILKEIPGHATYYRDRILEAKAKIDQSPIEAQGPLYNAYMTAMMYGMQTLQELPSPETVEVLGEMLSDDWTPGFFENYQGTGYSTKDRPWLWAMTALVQLPLEGRPANTRATYESFCADIPAWRHWYAQIKAGTRKIRFEGDPKEYSLPGAGESEVGSLVRTTRRPDVSAQLSAAKANERSSAPWPVVITFVLAAGLLVFVAVRVMRNRESS
ncbi:hypothetical protein JIN85_11790 [Luteolibacter pohnpeiensis]|uniref:Uncharacterized protein n=1 Tax=Luteolibacter pohnpeiensis TaxID=454153 RepID=A0A934VV13_9BACT|nr:hypothetical protein [Luteolibacter pohnpeiensis]MBK1883102.1 hypothetical protein [Luteolibacter pohnpeiensis]